MRPSCFAIAVLCWLAVVTTTGAAPLDIILATTTSTYDSGLLDVLVPLFERLHPYRVKVIAVGTGQALALGRRGEADALLVHAPPAEKKFMAQGHGLERHRIMHNDFVILGPRKDPAKLRDASSVREAFRRIARCRAKRVSRGDDSGTHKKEKALLKAAGLANAREGVLETGAGMAHSLRVANQSEAYILCDRGTYLALRHSLDLVVCFEGGAGLVNPYSVITVRQRTGGAQRLVGARAFAAFLQNQAIQKRIRHFGLRKFGQVLFHPDLLGKGVPKDR